MCIFAFLKTDKGNDNVQPNARIIYLPIYMIAYLKKEEMGDVIYDVDLEGIC
jgi:hypothetical protein